MSWLTSSAAVVTVVALLIGGTALGSDDSEDTEVPFFYLDWDEVAAAEVPPVVSLLPNGDGTCAGRIASNITIGPDESGKKRLTLAPVALRSCVFEVQAVAADGLEVQAQQLQTTASTALFDTGCSLGMDLCAHEPTNQADLLMNVNDASPQDIENTWCRIADGWAHTGVPDPPTVVYTRVYQEMQFCYNSNKAWIDQLNGVCFANSGSEWHTDPDECYFSDWEMGPAATVYLEIHGYFEKHVNYPFYPYHDMWNTVHGDKGTGAVYCTGEISGDYDGYVTVNNCGATNPEQQE